MMDMRTEAEGEDAEEFSAFVTQCDQDGDPHSFARPVWHPTLCGFCAKPVELCDNLIVISDYPSSIGYPYENSRAVLAHNDCGPGVGYWIDLSSLATPGDKSSYACDSLSAWQTHLKSKDWYHGGIAWALNEAHKLGARLRAELVAKHAPPPKPVVAAPAIKLVRRVPDPTSNPRSISPGKRARVMERDDFRCRRCGCGPQDERLVVDHITPVAAGGTAHESNLQTLCQPCNSGKSARAPHAHDLGRGDA